MTLQGCNYEYNAKSSQLCHGEEQAGEVLGGPGRKQQRCEQVLRNQPRAQLLLDNASRYGTVKGINISNYGGDDTCGLIGNR